MKKLIFKKLILDINVFFLIAILCTATVIWVIQAVNFLDIVSEDGHSLAIYFKYTLLNLPKTFSRTSIFIFFISVFYIILKYENNNELFVFWSNGITKKYFVNVVVLFSLLFLIIQILFTSYLVPSSQNKARSYIRASNIDFFPSLIKEKKFIDTVSNLTIFIEEKNEQGILKRIFLKDTLNANASQTIYAKEGKIISIDRETYIKLYDGKIINTKGEKINTFSFKETEINLSKYKTKTTTFPKIQEQSTFSLAGCISKTFRKNLTADYMKSINCKQNNMSVFLLEFFKRFYMPLYIPLITLISSLLILKSKDSFNFNIFKNIIFIIGVTLIVMSEITVKYFSTNMTNNILFLSFPLFLFILIYSFFFILKDGSFSK